MSKFKGCAACELGGRLNPIDRLYKTYVDKEEARQACECKGTADQLVTERVYDRAEAEALLQAWREHDVSYALVALEMATRYKDGVLEPLADLINERMESFLATVELR